MNSEKGIGKENKVNSSYGYKNLCYILENLLLLGIPEIEALRDTVIKEMKKRENEVIGTVIMYCRNKSSKTLARVIEVDEIREKVYCETISIRDLGDDNFSISINNRTTTDFISFKKDGINHNGHIVANPDKFNQIIASAMLLKELL